MENIAKHIQKGNFKIAKRLLHVASFQKDTNVLMLKSLILALQVKNTNAAVEATKCAALDADLKAMFK